VPVEAELRRGTGLLCFGADDDAGLGGWLEFLLRQRGRRSLLPNRARVGASCCLGRGGRGLRLFFLGVISLQATASQELMEVPAEPGGNMDAVRTTWRWRWPKGSVAGWQ